MPSLVVQSNACLRELMTSSVTIKPMLSALRLVEIPPLPLTLIEIGRLSGTHFDRALSDRSMQVFLNRRNRNDPVVSILQMATGFFRLHRSCL